MVRYTVAFELQIENCRYVERKKSGNQQEKKEHADKNETLLAAFNIIHNTERPHEGVLETIRT